ncbi:MAG: rRNA pseudouridine synthase [Fimbriimonadaceae bacterium]|nr:rRNA pseudouridine synthase [Fimbriimonadaceae bacterium]QYK55646.1 MAG: rRNA pseudouridine synthase [Fimbriimonadaceae bacterium]
MRIHRYIASSGLCSRRKAEEMIREGRVTLNGSLVVELGVPVKDGDQVAVDGQAVRPASLQYIVLNKPKGVVTTLTDPQRRPTVASFMPPSAIGLKPVGRLDMETEGLLILTNDGELAMRLTHPRYGVEKEYEAQVAGVPDEAAVNKLRKGVFVDGRKTAPAKVDLLGHDGTTARLSITIHEGRKRQVRLMCMAVGHPVQELRRVRIGPLRLKGMRPGEARVIGVQQVRTLQKLVGLADG